MSTTNSLARRIFGSSKNVLALAGIVVGWAAYLGLNLPLELVLATLGLVAVAIAGRAYEDGQAKRATVVEMPPPEAPEPK